MSLLRRSLTILFAVLVFFGSGGWVLTDHLCRKAGDACNSEQTMSCCCTEEENAVPDPAGKDVFANAVTDCCISTSSYFSMPLFRIDSQADQQLSHVFAELNLPVAQFDFSEPEISFQLPVKPPPDISCGETLLRLNGQLLI